MRLSLFFFLIFFKSTLFAEFWLSEFPDQKAFMQIKDFYRVDPYDSLHDDSQTCSIWYDDHSLFLQIETAIHPNFTKGNYTPRDKLPEADHFRLQLVTSLSSKFAYGFLFFPLENKCDLIRNFDFDSDYNWDSSYEYFSSYDDTLWTIKAKIPFSDLRFGGKPPYRWKLILTKFLHYENESYNAPYVSTSMHDDYFLKGYDLIINRNIKKYQLFFFRPYSILNLDLNNNEIFFDKDNFGIDLSYDLNNSSKMKLTVNPDFSDVPMDSEQDHYYSKHAPTLTENRYFFIEDLNAFGTDETLFYSRFIMQPKYALKITGSTENCTFGVLSTQDKLVKDEDGEITNSDDHYNLFAYKPIYDNFQCQFTFLNRMNEDKHNEILHLEPNWKMNKHHEFWLDANLSTKKADSEKDNGYFVSANYSYKTSNFITTLRLKQMSENYHIDLGRTYQENYYGWNSENYLSKNINCKILRKFTSKIYLLEEIDNETGKLLERYLSTGFEFYSNYQVDLDLDFVYVKERFEEIYFDKIRTGGYLSCTKFAFLKFRYGINFLQNIIYDLAESNTGIHHHYAVYGNIGTNFEYSIGLDHTRYFDLETEAKQNKRIDDNYWIGNFDLKFHLTNNISIVNGLRLNNYEYNERKKYVGAFSNFVLGIIPELPLYLGYKISLFETNDEFETNDASLYLKINYLLKI